MKVAIEGNELVIRIPAKVKNPPPSATGKTLLVASSKGNKETTAKVDGRNVIVGVNAYIYAEDKA